MFKITNVTNTLYSNQLQPLNNKLKLTYCIFSLKTRIQILMSDIILTSIIKPIRTQYPTQKQILNHNGDFVDISVRSGVLLIYNTVRTCMHGQQRKQVKAGLLNVMV